MEYHKIIKNKYLSFPVCVGEEEAFLEIFLQENKIFEFKIPRKLAEGKYKYDYIAKVLVDEYIGKELVIKGDFPQSFYDVIDMDNPEDTPLESRPQIHFTAKTGWINDPNGLIYDGEYYHMYFQYNPFNTIWANMSWGHAVSKDLIHWTQKETVMYPDENGMIFSGCGIIVDGEYCFPYTVAGTSTPWSDGKPFYQGLAKSFDKGETLVKQKEPFLGITGKDSRDPKIFWHEESKAYVMVLYLEGTSFGIFRSKDFKNWEKTQDFTLELAWECPDLLKVPVEGGGFKWMFESADGFYYWGDFDGYTFESDWKRHNAYVNDVPYAAQTFWGLDDRIVQVAWFRLKDNGRKYCGAMGVPKELTCQKIGDDYILLQKPVQEFWHLIKETDELAGGEPYFVNIVPGDDAEGIELTVNGSHVKFDFIDAKIIVDENGGSLPNTVREIQLLVDYNVMEVSINNAIIGAYSTKCSDSSFELTWKRNGNKIGDDADDVTVSHYSLWHIS